jgi:hypothetical protein
MKEYSHHLVDGVMIGTAEKGITRLENILILASDTLCYIS